jgi:ketosteroid isomerase-like protein
MLDAYSVQSFGDVFMKLLLVLTIALLLPTVSFGQTSSNQSNAESTKATIRQLLTKWNAAESQGDYKYIVTLLSNEFAYVGGMNRAEYLNAAGGNDGILIIDASRIEKIDVQVYGETAIATALHSFTTKANRPRFPLDKFWDMTVWVHDGNNWKCVKGAGIPIETK